MTRTPPRVEVTRLEFKDPRTPYSPRFEDVYFAPASGIDESTYVYLEGSGFIGNQAGAVTVAEIGFGVGLNFLLTLRHFLEQSPAPQKLTYLSFERFPVHREDLERLYRAYPELSHYPKMLLDAYPVLTPGIHSIRLAGGRATLILALGDATELLPRLSFKADHWYWDGFAPSRNPDAFSEAIFAEVAAHSKTGTRGASFTSAGWVRRGLEANGFTITKREGFGHKRECITGVLEGSPSARKNPAPAQEIEPWFSSTNLKLVGPGRNRIAVIGAGLGGSAIARELAERGAEVTVFDPSGIGSRASGNPAGLFNVHISKIPNPASRFSQTALAHLLREVRERGIPVHPGIFRSDALDAAPFLNSDYPGDFFASGDTGTFLPFCGILNPRVLCESRLNHPSIRVIPKPVLRTLREGGTFTLLHEEGDSSGGFDHVVYALGADPRLQDRPHLDHEVLDALPFRPIRGQIVLLRPTPRSHEQDRTLVQEGYLTPVAPAITGSGLQLLGATYQAKTIDPDQERIDTAHLLEDSKKWGENASFTEDSVDSIRLGFRMSTPDKLPVIGPLVASAPLKRDYLRALRGAKNEVLPDLEPEKGEWLLMGLGSRGITYSSYGARILAALMYGEVLPLEADLLEHLHPARFFVRNLRKPGLE
ncbi:MAG: FAD-dependent oxidoreductase [Proteobacteria bacterium]|nr:FAD-dependent oxidoreductase [Pseudomonadota bacterium]